MKKILTLALLLIGLTVTLILISRPAGAQDKSQPEGDPCEMKTVEKAPLCEACQTILKGYSCSECKSGKCAKCAPSKDAAPEDETAYKKPAYLFAGDEVSNCKKCPCCGQDKLTAAELVDRKKNNRCLACGVEGVLELDVCVRKIYHCPEHQDLMALKIQTCKTEVDGANGKPTPCKKNFVLRNISRVWIKNVFNCSKCKIGFNLAGSSKAIEDLLGKKCAVCKTPLVKTKKCSWSGKFPHVKGTQATQEVK